MIIEIKSCELEELQPKEMADIEGGKLCIM